jgi:hypothetical protein
MARTRDARAMAIEDGRFATTRNFTRAARAARLLQRPAQARGGRRSGIEAKVEAAHGEAGAHT